MNVSSVASLALRNFKSSLESDGSKLGIRELFYYSIRLYILPLAFVTSFSSEGEPLNFKYGVVFNGESRVYQNINGGITDRYLGFDNLSVIKQIGVNNKINVMQANISNPWMGNLSYVYQNGSYNHAEVLQKGGNNLSVVTQSGNGHSANIKQYGNVSSVVANVAQVGIGADISILQSDIGSRGINVEQYSFSNDSRAITIETY